MTESPAANQQPIAIVGVSALFPGSIDAAGFWRDILDGRDLLSDVPPGHWLIDDYYDADPTAPDKTYARRGGFLDPIGFDALGFGVPPSSLPATDTAQLLALILAQNVLQDAAREQFESMDRSRISVILGVTSAQELLFSMVSRLQRPVWVKALRESGLPEDEVQAACTRISDHYVPWQESSFPGLLGNVVAGRIANRLNLGGTNCVTDAACASALSAVSMAISELQLGNSDLVISGGVDTLNDIFMYMCFSKTPALSPSGDCRPFSDQADGTMLGEGLGMVALKRLSDAERDGDHIYAVIRGLGSSSDGRSKSVYAPVPEGQAKALRRAYDIAGYGPDSVELMEAHGTGTKAGDAAEFEGLRQVFGDADDSRKQWCALGSVKSQIGHTKAAAGAAGLFKAVMALHHKVLPPTIKIDQPNPKLAIESSPFYLNTRARPWIRSSDHPRRASVSAFGFGGSNFHLALEEYQGAAAAERLAGHPYQLLLLSADEPTALVAKARDYAASSDPLALLARRSQQEFQCAAPARLAVVVSEQAQLQSRLLAVAQRVETAPQSAFDLPDGSSYGCAAVDGKLAMLFPGQGSQYVGMGADLAMHFSPAREVWDRSADLPMDAECSLHQRVFPRPVFDQSSLERDSAALTATQWAQPAIGATSLSMLALLQHGGVRADMTGGHSFGEVLALHAAGVLSESDTLRVARRRGELMAQAASQPGAMTALSLPIEQVQELLAQFESTAVVANHNAPQQVVVSGSTQSIEDFEGQLSHAGISFRRLPVASGFHSQVVASSCAPFAEFLADVAFEVPELPVFGNASASLHVAEPSAIRTALAAQIAQPVRFVEMIEAMYADGARTFLEVGPGNVLGGLVGAILGQRPHRMISLDRKQRHGVESLLMALGRLAAAGVELQVRRLFDDLREPTPAPTHGRPLTPINGSNVGKPYPPVGGSDSLPPPNPPRRPAPTISHEPSVTQLPNTPMPVVPSEQGQMAAPIVPAHADQSAWLAAFQNSQQQIAEAHASFQRSMFESHNAFLQIGESALSGLAALANGQPPVHSTTSGALSSHAASKSTPPVATSLVACPAPTVMPMQALRPMAMQAAPTAAPASAALAAVAPPIALKPASTEPPSPPIDLTALMLEVVADKTGYPVDMLDLSMDMEGDLGIDSIKRVEILAAVEERAAHLPKLDRGAMSALHTLAEIVDYLQGAAPSTVRSASVPAATTQQLPTAATASLDLTALMLQVVADKTGYPVDMLDLSMDMEGDLGIDSIKRVEILAAVEERASGLPKLDRSVMSALHTLAEIVGYLQGAAPIPAVTASNATPTIPALTPASAPAASKSADLTTLMLQVVAEKTGYPVDMLDLSMDMEGDLGIDSIKRVEILAAVEERASGLPKLDRGVMSALHTLAEIVAFLAGDTASTSPSVAPTAATDEVLPAQITSQPILGRYRLQRVAAPATGMALPGLRDGPLYLIGDSAVGVALATELGARGIDARNVPTLPAEATRCVYLGGLREVADIDQAIAVNREAFALARQLAPALQTGPGLLVTVQDTGGSFVLGPMDSRRAWLSGLPALVKTAALEWPRATLKAIDLAREGRDAIVLARAIADELLGGGGEIEVMLRADGVRETLCSVAEMSTTGMPVLAEGDVVLVSGGARGVTAACVAELARDCRARFVLLGRTRLANEPAESVGIADESGLKRVLLERARAQGKKTTPTELQRDVSDVLASREIRATLESIAKAGAQARYVDVDVTDAAALRRLINDVEQQWGPVSAVVHAAGVLADKRIGEKTDAMFDRVFDTKVQGLRALLDATREQPLKLLAVFSSVSARCGNTGQADYAMANEILAKLMWAESRQRPGLVCKSFGWGPWEAGMVSPALRDRFAALGVPMIPLAVGARMFADELAGAARNQVELILGGEPRPEALLFDGAEMRVQALEISVARHSHAYLEGHAIHGQPVLPLVLAAEWLSRAARSFRPGLPLAALHDVKVLKGIRLGGFENGGDRFRIEASPLPSASGAQLQMRIVDCHGHANYSARVELLPDAQSAQRAHPGLDLQPWADTPIYADLLFHRGSFELIEQLGGISDEGISATLRGVHHAGWNDEPWQLDVAALDGGLQMAVLLGQRMLGSANLPTSIDQIRSYAVPPSSGLLSATAYRRKSGTSALTTDIVFTDANGVQVAEMLGVQNHAFS